MYSLEFDQFHDIFWLWMPREYNKAADWLTRWAMRKLRSDQFGFNKTMKNVKHELDKTYIRKNKIIPIYDLRLYQSIPSGLGQVN